jgi:hypothetical protein|tara:strand:- start:27 stop:332 length:306 start_codon:yes stop_codon:yes gene_type:complete
MNELIRLIRLTSGEEILVNIKDINEKITTVTDPVILIPDPGEHGRISFMPYLSYCEMDELIIKEEHIMFICEPEENLQKKYRDMVEGKIKLQTPSQQEIFQ